MGGSWKVILAFVGVFAAGAVFGGFFTARTAARKIQEQQQPVVATPTVVPTSNQAANPQPPRPNNNNGNRMAAAAITPALLQRLTLQLKLTDEQQGKVQPIIKRAAEDMNYLRAENFRATNRVLDRMHNDIGALLTEDQRADLEIMKRNIQERMNKAEKERRDETRMRKDLKAADIPANNAPASGATAKGN